MSRWLPLLVVSLFATSAHADTELRPLERRWPTVADTDADTAPTLGQRVTERLADYGDRYVAAPVGAVTLRTVQIGLDPRRQTARIAFRGGDSRFVALRFGFDLGVATPIAAQVPPRFQPEPGRERDYVDDVRSSAVVTSRVALSVGGKHLAVQLPSLEVRAAECRGARGVELTLPFVRRSL